MRSVQRKSDVTRPIEVVSTRLFGDAFDWQLAHPDAVVRFYHSYWGVPDWVEVNSTVALYEFRGGGVLRTRLTAEHTEGVWTAFRAHGARAHVNSHGGWMLTHVDACTDPAALRHAWLHALRKRPRRFDPDLTGAAAFVTVAAALENI